MSRTTNGNLTGKAAHIDKYDFLESLQPVEKLTEREEMQILLGVKKGFLGNLVNPTKEIIEATENEIADLEAKLAYGNDWEKDADKSNKLLYDEVKTTCENCDEGRRYSIERDEWYHYCPCCNGDWQQGQNCTEGAGSHNADDVRADMRGHL